MPPQKIFYSASSRKNKSSKYSIFDSDIHRHSVSSNMNQRSLITPYSLQNQENDFDSNDWINVLADPLLVKSWILQHTYFAIVLDLNGHVQIANPVLQSWAGMAATRIEGTNCDSFFPEFHSTRLKAAIQKAHQQNQIVRVRLQPSEFTFSYGLEVLGNLLPLRGHENQIVGTLFYFSLEPFAVQTLIQRDWKRILDNVDSLFLLVDKENKIKAFNRQYYEATADARGVKELKVGDTIEYFLEPGYGQRFMRSLEKAFTGQKICNEAQLQGTWYEISWFPIQEEGATVAVVVSATNIDQRVRNQEELRILTQELMHSNGELQQFAYITSHNLRAPVVNLVSLMQFLDETKITDPMNREIFDKIAESAGQLERTLNDLVQVVAIKDKKDVSFERVGLEKLLATVSESLEWQVIESEATILADFSAIGEFLYPKAYLLSILQNLLSNAMKYRHPNRKPAIRIESIRENGHFGLRIRDNGRGINLEKYGSRVFGLYQRFHESEGLNGRGLGLYIVKAQVESLGGWIGLESKVGEGSTFSLYLCPIRSL